MVGVECGATGSGTAMAKLISQLIKVLMVLRKTVCDYWVRRSEAGPTQVINGNFCAQLSIVKLGENTQLTVGGESPVMIFTRKHQVRVQL